MNIKDLAVAFLVFSACIFSSCSSSKKVQPTASRKDVRGSWLLNNISYDGLNAGAKYNITLLDEGGADCLMGSTWVLPNNGFWHLYHYSQYRKLCGRSKKNYMVV